MVPVCFYSVTSELIGYGKCNAFWSFGFEHDGYSHMYSNP